MAFCAGGLSAVNVIGTQLRGPIEHNTIILNRDLFGLLGSRCLTGSALLDCHVLTGFGIYMIGMLDSLSDVWKASTGTHHVISSCMFTR